MSLAIYVTVVPTAPARADDDGAGVRAGDGAFITGVRQHSDGTSAQSTSDYSGGTYHEEPACEGVCTGQLTCPDGRFMTHAWVEGPSRELLWEWTGCPTVAEAPPTITGGLVARALRRVPVPPSDLIIQPPDGRTLVNFDTNFYTRERTLFRSVTLLGQRVELRIVADSYTWRFGDGAAATTNEPGAPYPKLTITHNYRTKGRFAPRLDTTYVADFRVGGGAWQPVPGSVTIEGEPASLRAVEATPILVGYEG